MADLIFHGQFIHATDKDGETGLTITIDVYRTTISDGSTSQVVTDGSCTETGGGIYRYRYASADLSLYHYVANMKTASADVAQKHVAALGVVIPDALVSSRASQTSVETVDGIVDDILVDTGTTLPGTLATMAGYIDTEVAAILAAGDTEVAAIKTKTDLITASGGVTVVSPVDPDTTDLHLYAGDDYAAADGRAAEWSSSSWPDLTDATVTLYLRSPSGTTFSKSGSAPVTGSGEQTVRVELTAAETALLEAWPSPAELRIRATLTSGRTVTLVDAETIVVEEV